MTGLTNEQVQERIAEGKVNVNENPNTRTYKQIILENTLTFFNFLNLVLLVLVLFVRSYKNSMFMGIILIKSVLFRRSGQRRQSISLQSLRKVKQLFCVKERNGVFPQRSW